MDLLFKIILVLHIIGGGIGLLSGSFNIMRVKGDQIHRRVGIVFTYSMLTAGITSLGLSILHPNYFLFMVGVFTLFMVGTGVRYMRWRKPGVLQRPGVMEWLLAISMLAAGLVFVALGVRYLFHGEMFGLVFVTFGLVGLLFVRQDFTNYSGRARSRNFWLLAHLQRMAGGYIASMTAFLVVNAKYMPVDIPLVVYWLLPTVVVVPFIVRWSRQRSDG